MASETEELCDQLRELAFDFDRDDADAVLLRRAIDVVMRRDRRIGELEAAVGSALGIIDANRLVIGEYMGAEWLSRATRRIAAALTPPPKDKP